MLTVVLMDRQGEDRTWVLAVVDLPAGNDLDDLWEEWRRTEESPDDTDDHEFVLWLENKGFKVLPCNSHVLCL